ncbi:VOC family protein [Virgibacillus sp. MSP4-1]|uniref:VOC family protein n=1 Tax=Virgibacillus sp. MSP4-1 TaxID=2700081 RepID=UPI00039A7501|nr:VOC family protein [Virgibacillus sp. MSP4-1]QHS21786.1 VOC family protein [Virgibacillus sp. MSP4-1]
MEIYLDHVRANVSDLQRSIQWYEDTLGFNVTGHWPPENPNYAHFETEKGAIFAIMEHEESPSRGRFNFKVDNVDAYWEELKDKTEVVEELFNTPYGSRKFTIKDMDGNELGFVQL